MAKISNSDYQGWINRLNAIRSKHGKSSTGLTAPGVGTKITSDKMNQLLNTTIGSKWISATVHEPVSIGSKATQALVNEINSKLTVWENTCVHDADRAVHTHFAQNCPSNWSAFFSSNFSNMSDNNEQHYCLADHSGTCNQQGSCSYNSGDFSWCSGSDSSWSDNVNNGDQSYDGSNNPYDCGDFSSDRSNCNDNSGDCSDQSNRSGHNSNCSFYTVRP